MQTPDSSVTSSPPPPPYNRLSSAAPSFISVDPQAESSPNGTEASQNSSTTQVSAILTQPASNRPEKEPFDLPPSFDLSHSLESPPTLDTRLINEPIEARQLYRRIRRRLFICLVIMVFLIIGVIAGVASTIHSHQASQPHDGDTGAGDVGHNTGVAVSMNPGGISLLTGTNSNTRQDLGTAAGSSGTTERVTPAVSTSTGSSGTEGAAPASSSPAPQVTTSTPAAQTVVNQGATVNNAQVQTTQPATSTTQTVVHGAEICGSFPDSPECLSS